jgi:antirestriction protein ArdC
MKNENLYAAITQHIVAAIASGHATGTWTMPWHTTGAPGSFPRNAASHKPYRGINSLILSATAQQHGYRTGLWGTFNQWRDLGAQVQKGEKAAQIVFWKITRSQEEEEDREAPATQVFTRPYHVFNAAQVCGYTPPALALLSDEEHSAQAEQFFAHLRPTITHGAPMACYMPARDTICMPHFAQFTSAVAYYGTLGHECCHRTGHPSRLNRDLTGRFGSAAYAVEELVAELGAAFLCGTLGLAVEPRADHAQYIAVWLNVLKTDVRAVFTAASKAQAAVDWMHAQQPAS